MLLLATREENHWINDVLCTKYLLSHPVPVEPQNVSSLNIHSSHNNWISVLSCVTQTTRMQSETTDLHQRHVVRQVEAPYSVGSSFPYAPFKAVLTKISKWSRIQHFFRITPRIESLVVFAIPDISSKFQKDPSRTFWVIFLTHRQTHKLWQKHNLFSRGNHSVIVPFTVMPSLGEQCCVMSTLMQCLCKIRPDYCMNLKVLHNIVQQSDIERLL